MNSYTHKAIILAVAGSSLFHFILINILEWKNNLPKKENTGRKVLVITFERINNKPKSEISTPVGSARSRRHKRHRSKRVTEVNVNSQVKLQAQTKQRDNLTGTSGIKRNRRKYKKQLPSVTQMLKSVRKDTLKNSRFNPLRKKESNSFYNPLFKTNNSDDSNSIFKSKNITSQRTDSGRTHVVVKGRNGKKACYVIPRADPFDELNSVSWLRSKNCP